MVTRRESPHGFVTFIWDGKPRLFPLSPYSNGVSVSMVGAFPPKQVIGDFQQTSHEVLSALIQNDWSGGGQITDAQEATDNSRYAEIATLDTRYPRALSLLPQTKEIRGPNSSPAWCLGDLALGSSRFFHVSFGTRLCRISAASGAQDVVEIGNLPFSPVREGVMFGPRSSVRLFIPGGDNGYCTYDGTSISAAVTTVKPRNFVVHDNKLWALDTGGVLWKGTFVSGNPWTVTWASVVEIDPGLTPRGVVQFFDRTDAPTPHCITDQVVFSVDAAAPAIYETELNYAPHPDAGIAWERWRTDLYVAIGMGVQRYTLGTVNATGPDRDDGVGAEYQGRIVSMEKGFNDLFALIEARPGQGLQETWDFEQGWDLSVDLLTPKSSILRLTGMGSWHTTWISGNTGTPPTNMYVSTAENQYRLYWGWDGVIRYQQLPSTFENPRENPTQTYADRGELVSSWMDMGMSANRMTLASVEVRVHRATAQDTIKVSYQIDRPDAPWVSLPVITEAGFFKFRVGANGTLPDDQERYDGAGFSRVRYKIEMERGDDATTTPIMESIALIFIKRMGTLRSFRFRVDCTSPEMDSGWGYGNRERREALERMLESETFVPFAYNDRWYVVKMAGVNGQDRSGMDLRGDREVAVIEAFDL